MNDFTSKRQALFASLDNASHELKGTSLDQSHNLEETDNYRNVFDVEMYQRNHYPQYREQIYEDEMPTELATNILENSLATQIVCVTKNSRICGHLRGKKSIFKKPAAPIEQCLRPRKVPDFERNPHRWLKYNIADADMSDKTNTAAALNFLKEMDERHFSNTDTNMNKPLNGKKTENKIMYRKSSALKLYMTSVESNEVPDVEVSRPHSRGYKLIMPEYVVGAGNRRRQKSSNNRKTYETAEEPAIRANLILDHILDDGLDDRDNDQNDIDE